MTAAIHGNEINGVEIIRKIVEPIDPATLKGTIISVPVVNLEGYLNKVRYIRSNCDLNRCFPGKKNGSYPQKVAHALFKGVVSCCDIIIDIHTGSSGRENLPHLRVDLTKSQNADLLSRFRKLTMLQSKAPSGSLREASTAAGMTAIVLESGGSLGLEPKRVFSSVHGIEALLGALGMIAPPQTQPEDQHFFHGGGWIRSEIDGIFTSRVELGAEIEKGETVGEIFNPLSSSCCLVKSPLKCTILAKSHNQLVDSGVGLFRVGLK